MVGAHATHHQESLQYLGYKLNYNFPFFYLQLENDSSSKDVILF